MKVPRFHLFSRKTLVVLPNNLLIYGDQDGNLISVLDPEDAPSESKIRKEDIELPDHTAEVARALLSHQKELQRLLKVSTA